MAKSNIKSKSGFTIIEVVLVLAIAGLIFLMVFVALPSLQKSQRDTQRRNDYSMLSSAVVNYATNNGGKLTNLINGVAANWTGKDITSTNAKMINDTGKDPNGNAYILKVYNTPTGAPSAIPADKNVGIYIQANCDNTVGGYSAPKKSSSNHDFAIYGYLEGGAYCYAGRY